MTKTQWGGVVAAGCMCLLAWHNWQLREELAQLRQNHAAELAAQAASAAAKASVPVGFTVAVPTDCPARPAGAVAGRSSSPAGDNTRPEPIHNTTAVVIPPGANLLEAIKIIQREQAKTQPAAAGVSPFGNPN